MTTLTPAATIVKPADLESNIPAAVLVSDDADQWSDDYADEMAADAAAMDEYMSGCYAY